MTREEIEKGIQECYRELDKHGIGKVTEIMDKLLKLHWELSLCEDKKRLFFEK